MRASLVLPALILLSGCVRQHGVKLDLEVVKAFQPGVTTRAEVEAKLGQPTSVVVMGQQTSCSWSYVRATSSGSSESQLVVLSFGPDLVLLRTPTYSTSQH